MNTAADIPVTTIYWFDEEKRVDVLDAIPTDTYPCRFFTNMDEFVSAVQNANSTNDPFRVISRNGTIVNGKHEGEWVVRRLRDASINCPVLIFCGSSLPLARQWIFDGRYPNVKACRETMPLLQFLIDNYISPLTTVRMGDRISNGQIIASNNNPSIYSPHHAEDIKTELETTSSDNQQINDQSINTDNQETTLAESKYSLGVDLGNWNSYISVNESDKGDETGN